jgi:hypothetical protein
VGIESLCCSHDGITPRDPGPFPAGVSSRVVTVYLMRPDPADVAVARCIFAFVTIMIAVTISHVALELGFTDQGIRNAALAGALITGVVLAVEYFGHKLRKPK